MLQCSLDSGRQRARRRILPSSPHVGDPDRGRSRHNHARAQPPVLHRRGRGRVVRFPQGRVGPGGMARRAARPDPPDLGHPLAGGGLAPDLRSGQVRRPPRAGRGFVGPSRRRGPDHGDRRSSGEAMLESWAVGPNSGFWVVPVATAFAGSAGAMIAVLANSANVAQNAVCVHFMRRDAPIRQRRSTTWVDQSPILALARRATAPPEGPCARLDQGGPHAGRPTPGLLGCRPLRRIRRPPAQLVGPDPASRRPALGVAHCRPCGVLPAHRLCTSSTPLAIVAAFSALSAPSFTPIQQAVLYGFRSGVVNVAVRWGWIWCRSASVWPPSSVGVEGIPPLASRAAPSR